ncbi:copper resistance CopC family protein [Serinibacter arcticus]|uniref:copper resistance CopC family protein n=1 Tax=Serinibacter arcticus TaxID=1655435 RepID=UPI001304F00D|nr:copper resistance CopC family protein [Serinibacter arcticus]
MLRRVLAPLAVLASLLLTLGLTAAPASAHDVLISSTPADGETLTTAPTEIVLTFNNDIAQIGAEVQITGPDGTVVNEAPTVTGPAATVLLTGEVTSGTYSVAWRVTSSDGHPIDGTFTFVLDLLVVEPPTAEPTSESPSPSETPTETAGETASESASAEPSDVDSATVTETAPATEGGSAGFDVPGWVVALVAVGIVGGVVALIVRMRRDGRSGGGRGPTA